MSAQTGNNIAAFLKFRCCFEMHLHFQIHIFGLSFHAILFIALGIEQCDFLFFLLLQSDAQRDDVKIIKQMAECNQCSQIKGHTIRQDESKREEITHWFGSKIFKFSSVWKEKLQTVDICF
jgi:hypothetical protein